MFGCLEEHKTSLQPGCQLLLSETHISNLSISPVTKALASNQFPQGINFHSSLFLHPAPVKQIISMLLFLKRILFSISSYPSANPGHSTTVTAYLMHLLILLFKTFPTPLSLCHSLAQNPEYLHSTQGKG